MTADTTDFAVQAHRRFSVECFNRTWSYIEKPDRTAADDEAMILCSLASLWHWTQRPDCTDQNRSVGHWQAARVLALAGYGELALHHARRSLEFAAAEPPFYVAYAHEAIARAAAILGNRHLLATHLNAAETIAAQVTEPDEHKMLEQDLAALRANATA